jgi:hypothetical protein
MHTSPLSGYYLTQKVWTDANKRTRQLMLKEAGHAPTAHYARAFGYLPPYVRDDLINAHTRKLAAHAGKTAAPKTAVKPAPKPKPVKDYWYNNF